MILMKKIRIHAYISGRVTGVFFRANTRKAAERLGVKGWVRNLPDGRVEVVAEGEEGKVNQLIGFLRKGPVLAKVKRIDVKKERYVGEFSDFEVRR